MPDVLVEVRGSWLDGRQAEFLRTVHGAMAGALGSPPGEPVARLVEHREGHALWPDGAGDRFTRIEIALFRGRSLAAKRALYGALVAAVTPFGVPPADVKIVLVEVPPEDVGLRGGQAASDVELGYSLDV